ncbi:hypothetical protein A2856_00165 [Candidatus Uhrbacteria bacterium RIFCSPHIGHO2_01_FULL_63_20]|uniref:Haem-binding uptake Tiki superfamily ChaN domain-containing protein n=1 Tax=Candidatus Uhrbacteria bacterium RIFCSPHIGHO2_01_FULL_63_20 TaxID=1802385 RepID=A0A1F7TN04_9BACT|nr:MAG: hypothetical protein A2856_00165 [Candidatus Uhrbacteria bacterium RIFCSPHIGHO2_01_FULL_63_20]
MLFGCEHSKNEKAPQFREIEILLKKFVQIHGREHVMLFLENLLPPVEGSKKQMINRYGETGLIAYLGRHLDIDMTCPEPSPRQILSYVKKQKGIRKDDVELWIRLNGLSSKLSRTELAKEQGPLIERIRRAQDPFLKGTTLNDVGSLINLARDRYLCEAMLKRLDEGKCVFGVYGANHVIAMEDALRMFLEKKRTSTKRQKSPGSRPSRRHTGGVVTP